MWRSLIGPSAARGLRLAVACAAVAAMAGCASSRNEAEWRDPQFAGTSLRGQTVLVACEAAEAVVQRLCAEQLASQVLAYGASPVAGPVLAMPIAPRDAVVDPYLPAARQAGARAVLVATMAPDAAVASSSGLSLGIGIGGFGIGGGRGGVGVSAPIGNPEVRTGYAANGAFTDVASGKLMWSAKVSAPAADDVGKQVDALAAGLIEAASKAGFF